MFWTYVGAQWGRFLKLAGRFPEFVLLGVLAVLWGGSYGMIKVAVAEIPPLTLIAVRMTIAALVLGAVVFWRRTPLPRDGRTWRQLYVQSLFHSIGWPVLAWGQLTVDSALASVLNSISPLFIYMINLLVLRNAGSGLFPLAGVVLGICGVVLISGIDALSGLGHQLPAQFAIVFSAFLYGWAAIYGVRFSAQSPTVTATGSLICGAMTLLPLSLYFERPWTLHPSAQALGALVILAIGSTALALLIYFRLIRTLGAMGATSQSYLRAVVGVVIGVGFFGEVLSIPLVLGLVLAVVGVALINIRPRTQPRA